MLKYDRFLTMSFVSVPWYDNSSLRYYEKERTVGRFQHGERSMSEVLRKVERNRSSGVRRESFSAYVPLSAWAHKFILKANVAKRLYIVVAK